MNERTATVPAKVARKGLVAITRYIAATRSLKGVTVGIRHQWRDGSAVVAYTGTHLFG